MYNVSTIVLFYLKAHHASEIIFLNVRHVFNNVFFLNVMDLEYKRCFIIEESSTERKVICHKFDFRTK
jgi:hypothetical protein